MKQVFVILLAAGLLLAVYLCVSDQRADEKVALLPAISLSDMHIEVADTDEERVRGLSGRAEVPESYGMLFVFEKPTRPGFWMKDMLVPIDIIWLKDTGEVVGVEREVSPETFPNVFYPPRDVLYVLEVAAGSAERRGFSLGKTLDIKETIEKR